MAGAGELAWLLRILTAFPEDLVRFPEIAQF